MSGRVAKAPPVETLCPFGRLSSTGLPDRAARCMRFRFAPRRAGSSFWNNVNTRIELNKPGRLQAYASARTICSRLTILWRPGGQKCSDSRTTTTPRSA